MFTIALEGLRTLVLLGLVVLVWRVGRKRTWPAGQDWRAITGGFGLLLFGSLLDITNEYPALGHYMVIGDTRLEVFLEVFVGYLGGMLLLALGLLGWMPGGRRASDHEGSGEPRARITRDHRRQGSNADPRPVDANRPAANGGDMSEDRVSAASEEHIMAAISHAPSAFSFRDSEGRYRYVNKRFEAWYGVSAVEARGQTANQVLPRQRAEACVAYSRSRSRTGRITWF